MKPSKNLNPLNGNGYPQKAIIMFGPPGSGKGTQRELLSQKFFFYCLETSKVLEEKFKKAKNGSFVEIDGKKYYIAEEAKLWRQGILCSPQFAAYLIKKRVEEVYQMGKSLILDGSPRAIDESEQLVPFLIEKFGKENIKIIFLELTAQQTIRRNSNRRICQLMRHPILHTKENSGLKRCPLDGSKLVRRKDLDDPETIKVRLKEYNDRTLPVLKYFKEKDLEIHKVKAGQPVEKVLHDILKALGSEFQNYEL